jgi:hypothetical protein
MEVSLLSRDYEFHTDIGVVMTDASRTILARRLVVLATTAGLFLSASSFAQTALAPVPANSPAQAAPTAPTGTASGAPAMRHGHKGEHGGQHFKQMDTDGDGAISRAEYDVAGQKMNERRAKFFEMADANKDGRLSREEMQAVRQTHRRGAYGERGQAAQPTPSAPAAPTAPK